MALYPLAIAIIITIREFIIMAIMAIKFIATVTTTAMFIIVFAIKVLILPSIF